MVGSHAELIKQEVVGASEEVTAGGYYLRELGEPVAWGQLQEQGVGHGRTEQHQEDIIQVLYFFRGCKGIGMCDKHLKGIKQGLEGP